MSSEEIAAAYREGAIDWSAAFIPLQNVADKRDLRLAAQYSTAFFYFSAADGPYADTAIRKMLVDSIDWTTMRSSSGQLFPTDRLIPSLERMQATSVSTEIVSAIPDVSAGLPVLKYCDSPRCADRGYRTFHRRTLEYVIRYYRRTGCGSIRNISSSPNTSPYQFAASRG